MSQKVNNSTVSGKHHHRGLSHKAGFTIIEVMIVLAIAALIILIVLLAVPALQRQARNTQRDRSAQLIAAAVQECVTNNDGNTNACTTPASLGLTQKELGIFTGVHYGLKAGCYGDSLACSDYPTEDEPNWMFGLGCGNNSNGWFKDSASAQSFVVAYMREASGGWIYHCIDG